MHNEQTFKEHFPELSAATEEQISFWFKLAEKRFKPAVWKDLWDEGCELYVAHNLARLAVTAESQGAYEGASIDPQGSVVASKSVEKVSISYDTSSSNIEGAGEWNSTRYGRQLYELMMIVGAAGSAFHLL